MLVPISVSAFAIATCYLVVQAAEPELTKVKLPKDWLPDASKEIDNKCSDAKKNSPLAQVEIETWGAYCLCLKNAIWLSDAAEKMEDKEKAQKESICRLHGILMGKANAIGKSKYSISDSDRKKNVAQDTKEVEIYTPIASRELLFSSALLRWNEKTKELVFECNGDVELGATTQTYVMTSQKSKKKTLEMNPSFEIKPKTATQFKYSATVKSGMVSSTTVDSKSVKCTMQIDDVDIELTKASDTTSPDTLMTALGGKDKVKADLTKSACDRFTAAITFAFAKDGGKLKLGDLPAAYNQP